MAITEKLNTAWTTNSAMDAVFEVRAIIQNLSNVATEARAQIDAIAAGPNFSTVDAEIKSEAQACRVLVNSLVNAFDDHTDFINWTQP